MRSQAYILYRGVSQGGSYPGLPGDHVGVLAVVGVHGQAVDGHCRRSVQPGLNISVFFINCCKVVIDLSMKISPLEQPIGSNYFLYEHLQFGNFVCTPPSLPCDRDPLLSFGAPPPFIPL